MEGRRKKEEQEERKKNNAKFSGHYVCPLSRQSIVYNTCTSVDTNFEWCSIRNHWNNSYIVGEYGICSPRCKNQLSATENMASTTFQGLWKETFFSLLNDIGPHCHTYSQVQKYSTGNEEKFSAFLGM